jgi:pimeloyl-ACP methyl ester carboxylesterase
MKEIQDRYIKVGDINTRYWMEGESSSDVLLVHGLGGSVENWVHNIRPLAEKHRVYAVDLLGFGRSDKKPLIHDLLVLVRFIRGFMDTLGIEKATLVGNSLGGGLVLSFAVEYPQKVVKLVLVDNAGMGRGVITDFKLCSLPVIGELSVRPSLKGTARLWRKIVYDALLITPELVDLTYRLAAQTGAKKALLAALRAGINLLGQKDKLTRQLLARLNTVKAPALVVWGRQDRIIPPAHARIALEKIPGARLEFFDRCGHMPQLEYPDKFNELVLDFLAES